MTPDRFEEIFVLAFQMAGEIEWADMLYRSNATGDDMFRTRTSFTALAADPAFVVRIHDVLIELFELVRIELSELVRPRLAELPGGQEMELAAAALVQMAFVEIVATTVPEFTSLRRDPLRTKFRRLDVPIIQAPRDARVPSMAEQRRRIAAGVCPIDFPEGRHP